MRKGIALAASAIFLVLASGFVFVAARAACLLDSVLRFALQGLGTPAQVFPTRHLVVTGLYRYVRNPMYVAVVSLILGQALIRGDVRLLEYVAVVWLLFHLFVLAYEEPTLSRTFGAEYQLFCRQVQKWVPRRHAWMGAAAENGADRARQEPSK